MCLFLEMLQVKKCRNLNVCVCVWGEIFPYHSENSPVPKIRNYFFYSAALLTK